MNKHDFKIKGYIIEYRIYIKSLEKWSNWNIYYTKKFYPTKQIAEEALTHISDSVLHKKEYQIVPLYEINYERNS